MVGVVISLCCVLFLLGLFFIVLKYVANVSAIRMVEDYENSGEKVGFKAGFRLGWNRKAFRLFLIDLVIGLVGIVAFLLLMALAAAPLLTLLTDNNALRVIGIVAAAGLVMLVIFIAILAAIVLSLLSPFFYRAAVLEDYGVTEAISRGYHLVRQRLGDVILMGLIVFGLGLAFTILMIPVFILLALAGVVLGGLPGALVWWITSQLSASQSLPWVLAVVVGLPIFLLVVALPSLFLGGLFEAYKSTTWTLTYRELLALENRSGLLPSPIVPEPSPLTSTEPEASVEQPSTEPGVKPPIEP
jgi:hypothetical protein